MRSRHFSFMISFNLHNHPAKEGGDLTPSEGKRLAQGHTAGINDMTYSLKAKCAKIVISGLELHFYPVFVLPKSRSFTWSFQNLLAPTTQSPTKSPSGLVFYCYIKNQPKT